jgi:hypothetical protein
VGGVKIRCYDMGGGCASLLMAGSMPVVKLISDSHLILCFLLNNLVFCGVEWLFTIPYDRKFIRLKARLIYLSDQVERVMVIGKNRSIILQSNRPMLENKGLKNKRIQWKITEGTLHNSKVLQIILLSLEKHLKNNSPAPPPAS